jgi:hypothetical protein
VCRGRRIGIGIGTDWRVEDSRVRERSDRIEEAQGVQRPDSRCKYSMIATTIHQLASSLVYRTVTRKQAIKQALSEGVAHLIPSHEGRCYDDRG